MNPDISLNYFMSEKSGILVVSFIGPLVRSNAHILDRCIREVLQREASWVLLSFRDVPPQVDRSVFPTLARFQKAVRDKKVTLRIVSLHPTLQKALDEQALLRQEELANNLAVALSSVTAHKAKAA